MSRPDHSIDDILADAVSRAMRTIVPAVRRRIAAMAATAAEKLDRKRGGKDRRKRARRRRARPAELTRWVADRRARRVPLFVIELTGGLDTKKKIVAKYGENAAFEKGKPPPPAVASRRSAPAREGVAARVVGAKPRVIRKAAAR